MTNLPMERNVSVYRRGAANRKKKWGEEEPSHQQHLSIISEYSSFFIPFVASTYLPANGTRDKTAAVTPSSRSDLALISTKRKIFLATDIPEIPFFLTRYMLPWMDSPSLSHLLCSTATVLSAFPFVALATHLEKNNKLEKNPTAAELAHLRSPLLSVRSGLSFFFPRSLKKKEEEEDKEKEKEE